MKKNKNKQIIMNNHLPIELMCVSCVHDLYYSYYLMEVFMYDNVIANIVASLVIMFIGYILSKTKYGYNFIQSNKKKLFHEDKSPKIIHVVFQDSYGKVFISHADSLPVSYKCYKYHKVGYGASIHLVCPPDYVIAYRVLNDSLITCVIEVDDESLYAKVIPAHGYIAYRCTIIHSPSSHQK